MALTYSETVWTFLRLCLDSKKKKDGIYKVLTVSQSQEFHTPEKSPLILNLHSINSSLMVLHQKQLSISRIENLSPKVILQQHGGYTIFTRLATTSTEKKKLHLHTWCVCTSLLTSKTQAGYCPQLPPCLEGQRKGLSKDRLT